MQTIETNQKSATINSQIRLIPQSNGPLEHKPPILLIRHNDSPVEDRVVQWSKQNGFDLETRHPWRGDPLEDCTTKFAASVIFGGPFNVFETKKHPFLLSEFAWIEKCLTNDIPLLGICQGAQQIAHTLGAWVGPKQPEFHEFGMYELSPTQNSGSFLNRSLWVTQAHFHTYDLPNGAINLASTENYQQQAFSYGQNTFGLQFHAEQTPEGFRQWQNADWAPWEKHGAQNREHQDRLLAAHDKAQAEWFFQFMDRFLAPAQ